MIHGTTIGKHCVIESGSIVCDYSALGDNVLVTAGTLVKQRSTFEDNQILEGFPAKSIGHNQAILSRPDWAFSD
jgi:carbonic anhydrase/acetyltransferase-like protein (isoleucine patch superfamily)